MKQKMKIIGLTGGVGSGKSVVAGILKELGATTMELDKTGHEVLRRKEIRDRLVSEFGEDILDSRGEIDRSRLGKKVFSNRDALATLNSIVHPAIDATVIEKLREYDQQGVKVVILEAAAMLEAGRDWQVDEVWVTVVSEKTVLERLAEAGRYSREDVKARIASQISNKERIRQAYVVIDNDGTLDELRDKVKIEWEKLQERLK